ADARADPGGRARRVARDRPAWPLVCSSGWPNVAVTTLLRQLAAAGAHLRCHADFDPPGVLITRHLIRQVGAEPWRMTARDYRAGADEADRAGPTFAGSVPDTPWDPALARAMRARRRVVFEEDVMVALFAPDEGGT
ncbi:MAG: DUF2399 domain-containing protein, partial [Acidimicrobiales bacterium]